MLAQFATGEIERLGHRMMLQSKWLLCQGHEVVTVQFYKEGQHDGRLRWPQFAEPIAPTHNHFSCHMVERTTVDGDEYWELQYDDGYKELILKSDWKIIKEQYALATKGEPR